MRLRYTLGLAVLLAALLAYIYFVESKQIAEENQTKTIVSVEPAAVTGVTLTYGDRTITLAKGDTGWRVTAPVEAAADATAVDGLLRAISTAEATKTIDDPPADLAPFGLAPPFVTIAVTAGDATVPTLKVGKTTQVSGATYVQRADQPAVLLTGSSFRTAVDKQPRDLRDKTVVTFRDEEIDALTLRGPGGTVALAKQHGAWTITEPAALRADNAAVRALLTTLRTLRATDFANDAPAAADLAAYGLDTPERELTLRAGEREIRVRLGTESEQGVYVQAGDQPTVFVVGKWAAGDLGKGVSELRDKTLLTFDPTAAARIVVTRADGASFTLSAADGGWRLDEAEGAANAATVDAFVGALSRLAGTEVVGESPPQPAAELGLAAPLLTIAVTGKDGAAIGSVRLGAHTPDPPATEHTAQRDGDAAVFALPEHVFKSLDRRREDFLTAAAPPADPS